MVPVVPAGSPYARWMEAVAPGIADLDRWGRDPERATPTLVDAVARPDMPFRTALGDDTVAFAALKGALPYEARAWALRAIVGAPAPRGFVDSASPPVAGAGAAIAGRIGASLARDPALAAAFAGSFVRSDTERN